MSSQCSSFLLDPCDNFPCKRGKTCKLDADNKPSCACQEPSECPASVNDFDHVSPDDPLKAELEAVSDSRRVAFDCCVVAVV